MSRIHGMSRASRCVDERLRARAELAPLRVADEVVALRLPVEVVVGRAVDLRFERRRGGGGAGARARAAPPPARRLSACTRTPSSTRPASPVERVLPNVTSLPAMCCNSMTTCSSTWPIHVPSSSVIRRTNPPGSPYEHPCSCRPGSRSSERVHEVLPEPHRRPVLQHAEVDHLPDDGEVGVDVGADVDVRGADVHGGSGAEGRDRRQIVGAALVVALVRADGVA